MGREKERRRWGEAYLNRHRRRVHQRASQGRRVAVPGAEDELRRRGTTWEDPCYGRGPVPHRGGPTDAVTTEGKDPHRGQGKDPRWREGEAHGDGEGE